MTADPWRYDNKRVVVTGCASGIGRAVAEETARLGAHIVGLDRNRPELDVGDFVEVDLADVASIDTAVDQIGDHVDVLFNCAGISGAFPARQVVGVNFIGTRYLTERLIDRVPSGGAIASISSTGGASWEQRLDHVEALCATTSPTEAYRWCDKHAEMLEVHAYNLSKSAVIYYTMSNAVRLASRQVRINAIGPGATETPFLNASRRRLGDAVIEAMPKPLGRFATPDEQARVLVFLGSDAASYVTGDIVWVDGGYVAGALMGDIDGSMLGVLPVRTRAGATS